MAGKLHANLLPPSQQHSLRHGCVPEHAIFILTSFFFIAVAITAKLSAAHN
jgi:hypothetical protein